MAALETEVAGLKAKLADASLYERDPGAFAMTADALAKAEAALSAAEEEWLALEMKREELEQG